MEEHARKSKKSRRHASVPKTVSVLVSFFQDFSILYFETSEQSSASKNFFTSETIINLFISLFPREKYLNGIVKLNKFIIWFVQNSDVMAKFHQHI